MQPNCNAVRHKAPIFVAEKKMNNKKPMNVRNLCKAETALAALALLMGTDAAQAQSMTGEEWDNPSITSVNREAAHTLSIPMATEESVKDNDCTKSPYYQSLDGVWKFMWVKNPSLASTTLCKKDVNDAAWSDIDVPASWQVL